MLYTRQALRFCRVRAVIGGGYVVLYTWLIYIFFFFFRCDDATSSDKLTHMSTESCYFKLLNKCTKTTDDDLSLAGATRIRSIIKACHARGDELPTDLEAAIVAE